MLVALALALLGFVALGWLTLASGLPVLVKLVLVASFGFAVFILAWAIALVLALRTKGRSLDEAAADPEDADDEPDDLEPRDYGA